MSAAQVVATASNEEDVKKSLDAKDHGNAAFARNDFAQAVKSFTTAIQYDPQNHTFYSNRSAAYFKLNDFESAVADAEKCISLNADFAKGYSRLAVALSSQKKYAEAVKVYAVGLTKDPTDRLLTDGLAAAQKNMAQAAKNEEKEEYVVGIDLGTTYSCVGVWKGDAVVMVPNDRGLITTPSYVAFTTSGKRMVGHAAKSQAASNPRNTIYDIKRIIGQSMSDPGVAQDSRHFAFKVVEGKDDSPMVEVDMGMHGKKQLAPEEISAMVLSYLKKTAEVFLKTTVTKAVITVPAYFNDSQRAATKAAGKIAGLDVLRIINEPTAAALSYGLDNKTNDKEQTRVLIFDLGGGTFDVSVLTIENGIFEVKATGGDTRLGGEDFDNKVVEFLTKEVENQGLPDITNDERAQKRLRVAAEKAKRQLSQGITTDIFVEGLTRKNPNSKPLDFKCTITRERFEKLNQSFFVRCLETVKRVLKDAKMKEGDIDEVVLVGGSTRIPKIQSMLQEYFGGKELCRTLNPDEAVAYGAAVQGAILNGKRNKTTENFLLMDVTPLSLGIETTGRVMSVIIPRNTSIPCVKTQVYTTEENNQTQVDVCVYEGERAKTDQNNFLGKFTISGIEKAKRGEPKIDVSFSLDSNGILNVKAKDQKTGSEAHIEITSRGRASEKDIERMVKEAESAKKEDQAALQKIEAQNELEALIFSIMDEAKDCENATARDGLDTAATEAQQWLDENAETAKAAAIALRRRQLERATSKFRQ